jgi:hypothetical protein
MRLFSRRRTSVHVDGAPSTREAQRATIAHLADFVRTRVGVEAYVEPATNVTPVTLMLIATTGEWTRRRVPDERTAHTVGRDLGIPVYDVQRVGYPQRMRDWNSRQRPRRSERRGF